MARFSFKSPVFRYAIAVASQVNALYNELRDWTANALSVDSLNPRSVERRHYSGNLSVVGSGSNYNTGATAVGSPVVEISYAPVGPTYQGVAIGFVWPRINDGTETHPSGGLPKERIEIDWYDTLLPGWSNTYSSGGIPWGWQMGSRDCIMASLGAIPGPLTPPIPGYPSPVFSYGGGPCAVTCRPFSSDDWPPGGSASNKFGLFGTAGAANFDGKAEMWLFVEDEGL